MSNDIKEILAYFEEYIKITDMHDSEPMLNWKDLKIVLDYITNLQEQLHQASLDIQELTERDIECPSWCDKLTNLQEENERLKTNWQVAQEDLEHILKLLGLELGDTIYDIENKILELKGEDK